MSAERSAKFGTSERCRPDLGVLWRADRCLEPEEPQLNTPDSREPEAIHSSPPTGFERGKTRILGRRRQLKKNCRRGLVFALRQFMVPVRPDRAYSVRVRWRSSPT